jgi:hypothetical protein
MRPIACPIASAIPEKSTTSPIGNPCRRTCHVTATAPPSSPPCQTQPLPEKRNSHGSRWKSSQAVTTSSSRAPMKPPM